MAPPGQGRNQHFEVHGLNGSRWALIEIFDDQHEATEEAKRQFESGGFLAIRLLRETFDRDSNEFHSFELLHLGRRRRSSKYDEDGLAVPCHSPADLYSREGRRAITRLLAAQLDSWEMTAVEILYNLDNYVRLQNAGTHLQNAVQRIAIAQAGASGEPVAERIRAIFGLIDKAAGQLRERAKKAPLLAERRFVSLLEDIREHEDRRFLLAVSLAEDLKALPDSVRKFERLLSFMRYDHPSWAVKTLDLFLSEQLAHRKVLRRLVGDELPLIGLLEGAARLARGMLGEAARDEHAAILDGFLKARLLPQCRSILVGHVAHELAVNRRLTAEDLIGEFKGLARLGVGIGDAIDADLPDRPLAEMLEERFSRLLNPQTLGEYLAQGRNPAEKVQRLLDLERQVIGAANRRVLANYMLPLLIDPSHESFWFEAASSGHVGRLKLVHRLQKQVLSSGFQTLHKTRLAGQFDRLAMRLLSDSRLLMKLERAPGTAAEKGRKLLQMFADGLFTEGEAREAAEVEIRRYMSDPAFLAPITDAKTREERDAAIERLKTLLLGAGIAAPDAL